VELVVVECGEGGDHTRSSCSICENQHWLNFRKPVQHIVLYLRCYISRAERRAIVSGPFRILTPSCTSWN
jgi:hypothetical protein